MPIAPYKLFGLEICPSRSKTIRAFPLLLGVCDGNSNLIGHVANPLLCGSVQRDPSELGSTFKQYLVCQGWCGGGIYSSFALAQTFRDKYARLTNRPCAQALGVNEGDLEAAMNTLSNSPTIEQFCPPKIRQYILNQLSVFGITSFDNHDMLLSASVTSMYSIMPDTVGEALVTRMN